MEITNQFQQIAVGIDQQRLVASLEQVPLFFAPAVDVFGIAKAEVLHDAGEGYLPHLDSQVDVVGHQAEGVDTVSEAFDALL